VLRRVRTLIVSDLHLGNRSGNDVLRLADPRERLLTELDTIDRLVLLGDTVELMTRARARAMSRAEPVLREIGARIGGDREIVLVPGNHDLAFVHRWITERGSRLGLDDRVEPAVSRPLATVVEWLKPARVTVRYPGVWLREDVWATHGHYLDRHLVPESAFGLPRGRLRSARRIISASPWEYERHHRRRRRRARPGQRGRRRSGESLLARLAARPVATTLEATAELVRRATMPQLPVALMHLRLVPVTAAMIDAQMRHAAVPAVGLVARRLGVDADWLVFGHVHRSGPRDGDRWPDGGQSDSASGPRILNTGSWLYEPLLVDRAAPPHPYWPGGAVLLENESPPRAVGLLDDVPARLLVEP
jgi:UDP-2,3-diacylglucosamine pyrophosphatase LpxH